MIKKLNDTRKESKTRNWLDKNSRKNNIWRRMT